MTTPKNRPQATAPGEGPRDSPRPSETRNTTQSSCSRVVVDVETAGRGERPPPVTTSTQPQRTPNKPQNAQYSVEYVERAAKTADTLLQALQASAGLPSVLSSQVKNFLDIAKTIFQDHITICQEATTKEPGLKDILKEVQQVQKAVSQLQTTPTPAVPSWANIAARAALKPPTPPTTTELTLYFPDKTNRQEVTNLTNEAIIKKIQAGKSLACKKVLAAKKLPSGDVKLFVPDAQTRAALLQDQEWTTGLGREVRPNQQLYSVLVHNVPLKDIDTKDPQAAQTLQDQNLSLHPGLRISKLAWLKRKLPEGKTHSAIILSTTDPEAANQIITKGLISNYALYITEYYSAAFTVTQCFKCQDYGHISTHCGRETRCGQCAEAHNTRECPIEKTQCANCNQEHTAWSNSCPTRRARQAKATKARLAALERYRGGTPTAKT